MVLQSAQQDDVATFVAFHKRGKVTEFGIDPENVFPMWITVDDFYGVPLDLLSV
jgi:hypothetical protein